MSLSYIDAHAHLNFDAFDEDREELITAMKAEGGGVINVGIDVETSADSIALTKEHENIWASIGCHPTEVTNDFDIDLYRGLIEKDREVVVAVGECGLDYFRSANRDPANQRIQRQIFESQIELAITEELPLILHIRPQDGTMDAYKEGLEILEYYKKDHENLIGTAHFFVGDEEIAGRFLDLDFYISATGVITTSRSIAEVFKNVPSHRLIVETDAPFAAPVPHRGQRNEPSYVRHIIARLAELKGVSANKLAETTLSNTQRLFRL